MTLREQSSYIIRQAIQASLPGTAVAQALQEIRFDPAGRVILVAVGKAAYAMAEEAASVLGIRLSSGIIITKYGHAGALSRACASLRPAIPSRMITAILPQPRRFSSSPAFLRMTVCFCSSPAAAPLSLKSRSFRRQKWQISPGSFVSVKANGV